MQPNRLLGMRSLDLIHIYPLGFFRLRGHYSIEYVCGDNRSRGVGLDFQLGF
jgi:hypothetical protein